MNVNNIWTGAGRIANDLTLRINNNGIEVLVFTIAINDGTKEKPHTNFIDCTAYRNYAKTIEKYFKKGDQIILAGKLQTYTVVDRGENRKRTSVIVESFDFGQKKKENNEKKEEKKEIIEGYTSDDLPFYAPNSLDYFGINE